MILDLWTTLFNISVILIIQYCALRIYIYIYVYIYIYIYIYICIIHNVCNVTIVHISLYNNTRINVINFEKVNVCSRSSPTC